VTAVHKANIMKFTDGLFLQVAQEIAKEHPDIQFNDRIVDNMSMQLVQNPKEYDVIVMPNLYGDILSDLAAGLVGGLGLAPGANLGDEIALFEATHGSAPKYAGTNRINPMAMMLSGVMMLHHLGDRRDHPGGAIRHLRHEGGAQRSNRRGHHPGDRRHRRPPGKGPHPHHDLGIHSAERG
jgi:isocitrate dehydrogenase (NAD+)